MIIQGDLKSEFLKYPVRGAEGEWTLTFEEAQGLQKSYPGINVAEQCRNAQSWCQVNVSKRKKPTGMKRFLVNWLNRASERKSYAEHRQQPVSPSVIAIVKAFLACKGIEYADGMERPFKRDAEDLLVMTGSAQQAVECVIDYSEYAKSKGFQWNLTTVAKNSPDWIAKNKLNV